MVKLFKQANQSRGEYPPEVQEVVDSLRNPDDTVEQLSDAQVRLESGGRQFDSAGRPLVGRRSDGSLPPPNERAYGVSQIQIGTARETARRHGIPFDPNRLLTDAAYNRRLGDLHMSDLRRYYRGDETLALAAYHSGTGNVDRAIRQHGRAGFTRGLGPDGRNYVARLAGEGSVAGNSGGSVEIPPLPVPEAPTPEELAAMQQPAEFDVVNPFEIGAEIRTGVGNARGRQATYDETLQTAIAEFDRLGQQQLQQAQESTTQKIILNDDTQQMIDNVQAKALPLLQRRADLQRRRAERRGMNPLARLFRGLTDPAYNEVAMREEAQTIEEELGVLDSNYNVLRELNAQEMQNIQARFDNQTILTNVERANVEQDVRSAALLVTSATESLSLLNQSLGLESSVEAAKNAARGRIMSRLDPGQVLAARADAEANGGRTMVNGVEFSYQELNELAQQQESQALALEGMRLGYQSGQMQFADQMETRLIESLTPQQRQEALANGGVFQGQQLNMGKLTQAVARDQAVAAEANNRIVSGNVVENFQTANRQLADSARSSEAQTRNLMGYVPGPLQEFYREMAVVGNQMSAAIRQARETGTAQQMIESLLPRVEEMRRRHNQLLEEAADTWAGNSTALKAVARSWLTGVPLAAPQASAALISMARGNLPSGMAMSPMAENLMNVVRQEVRAWDARNPEGSRNQQQLITRINGALANARNNALLDNTIRQASTIASRVRVNGRAHPFSRIPADDLEAAIQEGDAQGLSAIARQYDMNAGDLESILMGRNPQSLAALASDAGMTPDQFLGRLGREVVAAQTGRMFAILDANFGTPDFRPSRAFVSLLQNPDFQRQVIDGASTQRGASFGDFLVDAAAGPGFAQRFNGYIQMAATAASATRRAQLATVSENADRIGDPMRRTRYVLGMIDGVSENEENLLFNYLQQQVGSAGANPTDPYSAQFNPTARTNEVERVTAAIDSIIMGGRIADPAIEAIRAKVAREWQPMSERVRRADSRVSGGN